MERERERERERKETLAREKRDESPCELADCLTISMCLCVQRPRERKDGQGDLYPLCGQTQPLQLC